MEDSVEKEQGDQLGFTPDQQRMINLLLAEGANLERKVIINSLQQYAGKHVSVDLLIEALEKSFVIEEQ
jgi:hypothetical protein